jgi:hypothetical protein
MENYLEEIYEEIQIINDEDTDCIEAWGADFSEF